MQHPEKAPDFTAENIDFSKLDDEASLNVCKLLEAFLPRLWTQQQNWNPMY